MKKKFTQAVCMVSTKVKVGDMPKDIAAVPGTMAYPYIAKERNAPLVVCDPNLFGVFDPEDGLPGLLYLFNDGSSFSGVVPTLDGIVRENMRQPLPHEC